MEGYLAWKWGTQAKLPADHPYKSVAPIVGGSPYDTWANGTFANGTLSDKTAGGNPDGDTLTNLLEYAFGTDPTV